MVLRKGKFLLYGIAFLLCTTEHIHAQHAETGASEEAISYFHRLDGIHNDSIQYARELYALARHCRKSGMYEPSMLLAAQASKILGNQLDDRWKQNENDCNLYKEAVEMKIFLLDLLTGRGENDFLRLSMALLDAEVATTELAVHIMYDETLVHADKKRLRTAFLQNEWPQAKHLNIITRCLWEMGKTEKLIEEINKAKRKASWSSLSDDDWLDITTRLENAGLLSSPSLSMAEQCVRIATEMYYPTSIKEILYAQSLPEYFSMYREAARAYVKLNKPLVALNIYRLTEKLLVKAIRDDYRFLSPSGQQDLWEISASYFQEMKAFAYEHKTLDGVAPFLYETCLLMKELFAGPTFQYHRYLSGADSTSILEIEHRIDSIASDKYTFKTQSAEDKMKWLRNEIVRRELEKKLISRVKDKKTFQPLKFPSWRSISSSLTPSEAVVELVCIPHGMSDRKHLAIILTKDNAPRLAELPLESKIKYMENEKAYQQVWSPIKKLIGDCTHLYISSEEALGIYSLATLHHENKYIIDEYSIYYLFSSSELPRIKSAMANDQSAHSHPKDIFLFGGADFNDDSSGRNPVALSKQGFQDLQGTVEEIKGIEQVLPSQWKIHEYTGAGATEAEFRKLSGQPSSPAVIHLATHSFQILYDPKIKSDALHYLKGFSGHKNPALRTGIVLSGANHAWTQQQPMNTNDGILTAFEISSMNLSNTELIVLSGCNSEQGVIYDGKYSRGLPRAFRQAGVKSQIVSFRNVTDSETKEFMIDFYQRWLAGESKQEAFIQVQRKLKNKYPNEPQRWAYFVLIE